MANYQNMFGDLGSAVSDIFASQGNKAEANAYGTAAGLATQNAQIEQQATAIQEMQTQRGIYQTIGAQQAEVGGAGFAASGTAKNLLASSASQGALAKATVAAQGLIQEQGYKAQAASYQGMQQAAEAASSGGFLSSALGIGGAIASFL